jgi:hypothetical protein
MTDKLPDNLEACYELIQRLHEENTHLRQTASVFGQLAERLNHELRVERSLYSDGALLHGRESPRPDKWGPSS